LVGGGGGGGGGCRMLRNSCAIVSQ